MQAQAQSKFLTSMDVKDVMKQSDLDNVLNQNPGAKLSQAAANIISARQMRQGDQWLQ